MERDEILAKSRQENRMRDEMERDASAKASAMAFGAGIAVCAAIMACEAFLKKEVSWAVYAAVLSVYFSMFGVKSITYYSALRKRIDLVSGIIALAIALVFFVKYINASGLVIHG